jgi:hypothetical protein
VEKREKKNLRWLLQMKAITHLLFLEGQDCLDIALLGQASTVFLQIGHVLLDIFSDKAMPATNKLDQAWECCCPQDLHLGCWQKKFRCLRTSIEAILETLKVHFIFVASDSITAKASKL